MERERCKYYLGNGECGFDEQAYTRCFVGERYKQCNFYEEKERFVGYPADMEMSQDEVLRAEYRINFPKPIGVLTHKPTHSNISVYSPIGWFKRRMLKWCFGLEYKPIK